MYSFFSAEYGEENDDHHEETLAHNHVRTTLLDYGVLPSLYRRAGQLSQSSTLIDSPLPH